MLDGEEGKKDEFEDLPDGEGEDGDKSGEGDGEEDKKPGDKPGDKKPDAPTVDEKDNKFGQLLADKDRALKEERKRARGLERELEEAKKAAIKPKEEDLEEKPVAPSIDPKKMADDVLAEVTIRQYNERVTSEIKAVPGMTKAEAREIKETLDKLPKTGDPKRDVYAARAWIHVQEGNDGMSTPQMPMGMGAGASRSEQTSTKDFTPSQKEIGRRFGGLEDEDYKKFGAGTPRL